MKSAAEAEVKTKADAEVRAKAEANANVEAAAMAKAEAKARAKADAKVKADAETMAEAAVKAEATAKAEAATKAKVDNPLERYKQEVLARREQAATAAAENLRQQGGKAPAPADSDLLSAFDMRNSLSGAVDESMDIDDDFDVESITFDDEVELELGL
mmetsp:Transcript_37344/g.92926  ORF Transcript_37344/g.92926 Transcript_37344/m.92926 type:complete len:158 (-) Transcript_37344:106-579(-)